MSSNGIGIILLFLNFVSSISGLNHEGLSLLSWLSTFNSSSAAAFFSSWNPSHSNPCTWDYIKCNHGGFVTEITISNINLHTTFPTQIVSFQHLTALVLSRGNLTGEIPPSIGNLSSLVTLNLSFNAFSGNIPAQIGMLSDLQSLSLNTNSLHGGIPREIGNCSKLQLLELFDNHLSGKIPTEIGQLVALEIFRAGGTQLKNLKTLSIYTSKLNGHIPPEIGNSSALEELFLYGNQLSGEIPEEVGSLKNLKRVLLWQNQLSGRIPNSLGNCSSLVIIDISLNYISGEVPSSLANLVALEELLCLQLELDNNRFSGEIPATIGQMKELSQFFAWQNQLRGSIPTELANCEKLQHLDISHNFLTEFDPIVVVINRLSGEIPQTLGNCTSLTRLRMGSNNFSGHIPSAIGLLHIHWRIPPDIGNCSHLEMVDLRANKLQGKLTSLNKMVISGNSITGFIPKSLGNCKDLQLLDISRNKIAGWIPEEIGHLQGLDILLNLSWNALTGPIPESFSNLSKLANLDLSHNMLTGSLMVLGGLDNLVSLDVSFNNFSGILPDTKLFHNLPSTAFSGNQELCINQTECGWSGSPHSKTSTRNLIMRTLFSVTVTILVVIVAVYLFIRVHGAKHEGDFLDWHFTPFQKLNFSVNDILTSLSDSNIIGKGCSGVVYRVETTTKQVVAVKKLWPIKNGEFPERDLFSAEVQTLGSIRHKNIVRLLGCCDNGKTRLLLFDYISNGSLAGLLHEKNMFLDWDARYKIILGAAQGLAYLHHDCIPPIVHRDIKSNNILVGPQFEAFLADFGLAKLIDVSESPRASNIIAGSYGYIAPEYGYNMRITEKSDVYSLV
ncbi:hypothetical protein ERO13_A02G066002v2 [Gossypium hirsutum]|nr:hypothetical protein ERO13_A02G066002v2 [Gossypium hirsutum]